MKNPFALGIVAFLGVAALLPATGTESIRMLFLGNSITRHAPKADIGWTGDWGMAASEAAKDYAHLVASDYAAWTNRTVETRIRNIATFETGYSTYDVAGDADLAADVAFDPDIVVIAIAENVQNFEATSFRAKFLELCGLFTNTVSGANMVIRSSFWNNTAIAAVQSSVAEEIGAHYVDAGVLNQDQYKAIGQYSNNGVAQHPSDTGMRALADLILYPLTNRVEETESPETSDDDEVITEVGSYAAADGEGTLTDLSPCAGGKAYLLSTGEWVHRFSGSATFCAPKEEPVTVDYLLVGGGGGGGGLLGGGGGAGGVVTGRVTFAAGARVTVTVGAGGAYGLGTKGQGGGNGGDTTLAPEDWSAIATAYGGGGGAGWGGTDYPQARWAGSGGSGGGACYGGSSDHPGTGVKDQGHGGGSGYNVAPGGGGGAGSKGGNAQDSGGGGVGGDGVICRITGAAVVYGTGGGGGASTVTLDGRSAFSRGLGGSENVNGGAGSNGTDAGGAGTAGTGAGGGGGGWHGGATNGGSGGSGYAVFRFTSSAKPYAGDETGTVGGFTNLNHVGVITNRAACVGGSWPIALTNGECVHVFTDSGILSAPADRDLVVRYLAVGGGGGGGGLVGGGGGAGGVLCGTLTLKAGTDYQVTVGAGGAGGKGSTGAAGTNGGATTVTAAGSSVNLVKALGGGGGGGWASAQGGSGSSGGGAAGNSNNPGTGDPDQGNDGGQHLQARSSGGGGGAYTAGQDGSAASGAGGDGVVCAITGTNVVYATGGGGGGSTASALEGYGPFDAGAGGSENVNGGAGSADGTGTAGKANSGAGGGGGGYKSGENGDGAAGGSGVFIIRYAADVPVYFGTGVGQAFPVDGTAAGTSDPLGAETATTGGVASVRGAGGAWKRLACGDYVHTFSASGTYATRHAFVAPPGVGAGGVTVHYLVVAGGGAGGWFLGGGGGGGGVHAGCFRAMPGQRYDIAVGAGGYNWASYDQPVRGTCGGNSSIAATNLYILSHGGGGGGAWGANGINESAGLAGGSGGGATCDDNAGGAGLDGGCFAGGSSVAHQGGGGGACAAGADGAGSQAGAGGDGYLSGISGTVCAYGAGGGAGAGHQCSARGLGGSQGYVGAGGNGGSNQATADVGSGANGYGSGGGGSDWPSSKFRPGGNGGSGCVILRYACAAPTTAETSGNDGSTVRCGAFRTDTGKGVAAPRADIRFGGGSSTNRLTTKEIVHTFTASGTFTNLTRRPVEVHCLMVGGGGAGGNLNGGGGGGGGVRYETFVVPKNASVAVTVGAGGTCSTTHTVAGGNGGDTSVTVGDTTYVAYGGGGGASHATAGAARATGGGGVHCGNTGEPLLSGQAGGFVYLRCAGALGGNGGTGYCYTQMGGGGGGGGAGGDGYGLLSEVDSLYHVSEGGDGGPGVMCAITGEDVCYGGGGGGGGSRCGDSNLATNYRYWMGIGGVGGAGGGGTALTWQKTSSWTGGTGHNAGTDGLGGGGAGPSFNATHNGYKGGSGVVIFRYAMVPVPTTITVR